MSQTALRILRAVRTQIADGSATCAIAALDALSSDHRRAVQKASAELKARLQQQLAPAPDFATRFAQSHRPHHEHLAQAQVEWLGRNILSLEQGV